MEKKVKYDSLSRKMIEQIALDYIVNENTKQEIIAKYNITKVVMTTLINRLDLVKKRDKYREKVLEKSLERCSTYQSKIIFKATELLHNHVDKLTLRAREQTNGMLASNEIRDVMAILQIISKENRLDNDKPTDRSIKTVEVAFPEGFKPITQAPKQADVVDAEFTDVSEPKEEKESEPKEEEIEVEVDEEIIGGPLG